MRIGEFARKHNITQDTIRHYLDMGLLVTEKNGGQFKFSNEDSWDIEEIFELKKLGFSLLEIQEVLCFHRLAGDKTEEYRDYYLSLLESKKKQIMKEQNKYKMINSTLKNKILELKMVEVNKTKKIGLPMSSMNILQCPKCKGKLDIADGIIVKSMVMEANIKCECDYTASIKNGIYIDSVSVRKKTLNGSDMPTKREFLDVASPKFINFFYNGMSILIENIHKHCDKPKYIMELEYCVGTFLMQYIKHLPSDATYILIGEDLDRLTYLKSNIELHYKHNNFIFFCCDINRLPIANSTIDIIIDHWMTKNYAQSNNQLLFDVVSPYLKEEGLLAGAYPYFKSNVNDLSDDIPLEIKDYVDKRKLLRMLEDSKLSKLDISYIGPIIENNPYSVDIQDKELYLILYVGEKKNV